VGFPVESGKIQTLMTTPHPQLRQTLALLTALLLLWTVAFPATAEEVYPGKEWRRAESAEALGWSGRR
jgi:hypothetical protein